MPNQPQPRRRTRYVDPSWITAITVLLTAVVALAAWVDTRFGKEGELRFVRCYSETRIALLTQRAEAANLYIKYVNAKLNIATLSLPDSVEEQWQERYQLEGRRDVYWEQLERVRASLRKKEQKLLDDHCDAERVWHTERSTSQ